MATASVHDVASYILKKAGPMSAMKLQKLAYYCQAWSLVWEERPMFRAPIQAWVSGPVIPALYGVHRGQFTVSSSDFSKGDPGKLDRSDRETIDAVLKYYGKKTAQWLSDLTHAEDPWRKARKGVPEGERSSREITLAAMHEYYSSL